jgi:hypothetical protein
MTLTEPTLACQITPALPDDPYAGVISNLLATTFPGSSKSSKSVLEAIFAEVLGTKQHRYGPTPDPETQVSIRHVVRTAVDQGKPIPILVPWGGSKQGPYGVDLADLMALRQIQCLYDRVKSHYTPSIEAVLRVENRTDDVLFSGVPGWSEKTQAYTTNLMTLGNALHLPAIRAIRPESELFPHSLFREKIAQNLTPLSLAIQGDPSKLATIGWNSGMDPEKVDYYRRAYAKFYPQERPFEHDERIALYFAAAMSRRQLGGMGDPTDWMGNYLTLSFSPPVPTVSTERRIFYRTIPERYTNQHRAPWIGKGYIRIRGNEATPAIAGWDGDGLDYHPMTVQVSGMGLTVSVQTDYVVES